jgi:arylsulfatase
MDLLPTFLELAGTRHPGASYRGRAVLPPQGVSLLPVFYGKASAVHTPDTVIGIELFSHRSIRQGDWKLVWDQALPAEQRRWQLFNITSDFEEQHDLSQANPRKAAALQAEWDKYQQQNGVIY